MKADDIELLKQIAEFEDSTDQEHDWPIGWCWRQVRIWPATLNRLCLEGFLDTLFRSNSYTGYKLTPKARAVIAGKSSEELVQTSQDGVTLPDDLFADIIGHDEVKELLRAALSAERPVHVLLSGPPALAKTLFLWDLERAGGEAALWLLGSATSKAGLWDIVAERRPRWLLIDELDKMGAVDTAALLSLMEGGRLVRAKVGRQMEERVPVWVIAATNDERRLSPELRSRFAVRTLRSYSRDEYYSVIKGVLMRREGITEERALEIARILGGRSLDVRDAVRVARLTPQVGVEKAVKLLLNK
jgi:Holliday junction DNA helicase RuvB